MVVGEQNIARFKGRLREGERDAVLIIHADAPEIRLAFTLAAKLFTAESRHGLQGFDGGGDVDIAELAIRAFLNLGRHTFDGLAIEKILGVLVGKVNDHQMILPKTRNDAI